MNLTITQKQILKALSCSLFKLNDSLEDSCDWNQILDEAHQQGVFMLVYEKFRNRIEKKLDAEDRDKWAKLGIQFLYTSIQNSFSHTKVHNLLDSEGIPYVILKGQASAAYYPEPLLRSAGDIDFLIKHEDIERTTEILEQNAYTPNAHNACDYHLAFHKRYETFEMHWEPNGIPNGEKGELCRVYLSDTISSAVLYEKDNQCFYIPDKFHHGLVILLHIACHMLEAGVGLRHLCDWAVFVNSIGNEEFIEIFQDKLKKVGLWRFAQLLTQLSVRYLGCEYRQWADEDADEEYLDQLITDLFDSGNFGKKDMERSNEAKLLTLPTQETITNQNKIAHIFIRLANRTKREFDICNRMPVLVPFACIYLILRHHFRILIGKKPKVHLRKMFQGADERRKIYQSLKLFE